MLTCEEAVSCGYLLDVMARLAIAALRQIGERSRITGSLPEKQSQNPDRALRSRCDSGPLTVDRFRCETDVHYVQAGRLFFDYIHHTYDDICHAMFHLLA